jgi:L-gulonolactone oxidase
MPLEEWRNWSGEQSCRPARIVRPGGTTEVSAAVEQAARDGHVVKAVGCGHSFTPAALTDGVMVDLARMDKVLDADRSSGLVRVQAGITLRALNKQIASFGLGMENLGDIDRQTLAGALATGTHGTGATLRNLSSQVVGMELVTGSGEVVRVEGDDLRAARVSLGALGLVTEVTLRCMPAYVLRGVDAPVPLEELIYTLDAHVDSHRHFEFFLFPHAQHALTRTNDIVDGPAEPWSRQKLWVEQRLLGTHTLRAICEIGKREPRAIPFLNRAVTRLAGKTVHVDRSDRIFCSPRDVRFTEMEYAIPRGEAVTVLREVLAMIDRDRIAVNFPIEMRFVAPDDAFLSPAFGRDTAYVAVHMFQGMEWEPFFRAYEEIARSHVGRPHWGKRHFQTAETLAPLYPEWDRFAAVRARLDPDGRFAGVYADRVLGPVRAPEAVA